VRSFLLFTLLATGAIPMTTDAAGSGAAARQDVSRIRELNASWADALKRRDAQALAALVTEDAVFLAPGMPAVKGKSDVRALYEKLFAQFSRVEQTATAEEIVVAGDWAYQRGPETLHLTPANGSGVLVLQGNGMSILRREQDGTWKFARGITTSVPQRPPGAPAAAEKR